MPRPTVHDIARNAGVSLATVDRVLNERPGVRARTIERVNEAVERLGYVRDVAAANLARQRDYQLVFVIPDGRRGVLANLNEAILEAKKRSAIDRTNISIVRVPSNDPHRLAAALNNLNVDELDGLTIFAPETPQVRDAIRHLRQNGLAVVAIVSDLPNSDINQFVGINNVAAGRTAGLLLGRFLAGQVADVVVLAGSMQARDHAERRLGFDQIMAEQFDSLNVLPTIEAWDDTDTVQHLLTQALNNNPRIKGIYSVGAGNSGLASVLRDVDDRSIMVVAHELTSTSRAALEEGTFDAVIAQDQGHIVRSAIRMMRAIRDRHDVNPAQEKIRIEVILKENLI